MSTLNEKEWLIINEITAEIYTKKHINSFAEAFLLLVRRLIPYKSAVFTILHSDTTINENKIIGVNLTEDDMKEYNNFALVDFTNYNFKRFRKSLQGCFQRYTGRLHYS